MSVSGAALAIALTSVIFIVRVNLISRLWCVYGAWRETVVIRFARSQQAPTDARNPSLIRMMRWVSGPGGSVREDAAMLPGVGTVISCRLSAYWRPVSDVQLNAVLYH